MGNPRGRKPKPIEEKRRTGNPGNRPLPEVSETHAVANLDVGLMDLELDDAIMRVVEHGARWLAETDLVSLLLLRQALEDLHTLRADGALEQARKVRADIVSHLSSLGFDPAGRARLGVAEIKAMSALDEIEARARKARGGGK